MAPRRRRLLDAGGTLAPEASRAPGRRVRAPWWRGRGVEDMVVLEAASPALETESLVPGDPAGMAAWLAFLKSRLLLPREEAQGDDVSAEDMARRLSFRLKRLEAMRNVAAQLMTRMRLGRDVFARGMPQGTKTIRDTAYTAKIYDLLHAYADQRRRTIKVGHVVKARPVWSIQDARERLERLMGDVAGSTDWVEFNRYLERLVATAEDGRTILASSFGATLEMAREGEIEIRQEAPFAPIYMRARHSQGEWRRVV